MTKEYDTRREDADYSLRRGGDRSAFLLEDKRTGHRVRFHDCVPNGFGGNVFLRYLAPDQRNEDYTPSSGNRVALLDKDSLPEWLIDEFRSIRENGHVTRATDPRGDES